MMTFTQMIQMHAKDIARDAHRQVPHDRDAAKRPAPAPQRIIDWASIQGQPRPEIA